MCLLTFQISSQISCTLGIPEQRKDIAVLYIQHIQRNQTNIVRYIWHYEYFSHEQTLFRRVIVTFAIIPLLRIKEIYLPGMLILLLEELSLVFEVSHFTLIFSYLVYSRNIWCKEVQTALTPMEWQMIDWHEVGQKHRPTCKKKIYRIVSLKFGK